MFSMFKIPHTYVQKSTQPGSVNNVGCGPRRTEKQKAGIWANPNLETSGEIKWITINNLEVIVGLVPKRVS